MVSGRHYVTATRVFVLALATRLVGVAITTFTDLNTYAQADAGYFSEVAAYVAEGVLRGTFALPPGYTSTYHTWGTALAPFWLVPGPSRLYARIGMAILGAYAVYNVYLITRACGTRDAAVVAVTPMLVYPSFLLIHSTVLREAAILLGITTAVRLLVLPPREIHPLVTYAIAGGFLWFASIFRPENRPVFAALLALAVVVRYRHLVLRTTLRYTAPIASIAAVTAGLVYLRLNTEWLAGLRYNRARGRTEYLGYVFPDSLVSVVAFSWLGAIYFLFTPFPWMVSQVADLVAVFEALGNLCFALFALFGVRAVFHRRPAVAVSLAAGIVLGAVLYGLATANVGTAVRHRQMLLWALFVFGGVGIDERVDVTLSTALPSGDRWGSVGDD